MGEALVRAEAVDGSGVSAECRVVVKPRLVQSISLKLEKDTVAVGDRFTVLAEVLPKNATNHSLQWMVSESLLLKYLGDGTFEALKPGNATIVAQAQDASRRRAICKIQIVVPNGLRDVVAKGDAPHIRVEGNTLVVEQVPRGQWLRVSDLQGRLLHQARSNGEDLRITFPVMPRVLLIHVGSRTYKLLLAQP